MTQEDVFPDRDMAHLDKIRWVIETQGWCAEPMAAVEDPPTPGYTYTIGFEDSYDHPEVVIFGLQPVAARGLLEMIAMHLSAGGVIPNGVFTGLLDSDLPSAMLPVSLEEFGDLFETAHAYHDDQAFRVAQFVWPDKQGKLPWDEGFDDRLRLAQPVIGT